MSLTFAADCLPLPPATLPHTSRTAAWQAILQTTPELVLWPQLPRRSPRELPWAWAGDGFPGLGRERPIVETPAFEARIEQLYLAYLEQRLADGVAQAVEKALDSPPWAEGALAPVRLFGARLLGPVSLALLLLDEQERPLLLEEERRDALAKHLYLRVCWLEAALAELAPATLICLDEPFLDALQSPFLPLQWRDAAQLIEEVFDGMRGYRGLAPGQHVDWQSALGISLDLVICPEEEVTRLFAAAELLHAFLERGSVVAWALVPNDEALLEHETADAIARRFGQLLDRAEEYGLAAELLVHGSLVTVAGGLDHLSTARAERTLALLAETSALLRARYLSPRVQDIG